MSQSHDDWTVKLAGDVRMPLLGFGTWQLTGRQAYEAVRHALEVGYRHIDTATMYENENEVGRALRDSSVPRDEVFVTTKLPPGRARRARQTIEASLGALGVDQVDLWLIHWPPGDQARPEVWRELLGIRDEGLARAVGVSNYSTDQVDELIGETGEAPSVNQIRWSPFLYDDDTVREHRERGVVLEGYSPFRAGRLRDPVLAEIASAHQVTPAQVVLRWHLEHGIVVIPKSATPERITANFDVFNFSLSEDEMARIDALGSRS
jgi:diketogulonate reductase-like aldo/keto reductase